MCLLKCQKGVSAPRDRSLEQLWNLWNAQRHTCDLLTLYLGWLQHFSSAEFLATVLRKTGVCQKVIRDIFTENR